MIVGDSGGGCLDGVLRREGWQGSPTTQPHPFVLRLRGEGSLRVTSCLFTEETVSAVHPLLGPLNFRRDGIVAMERTDPKPKPAPEP